MRYHTLGSTGLRVSALAFGAGPVSQLLTGDRADLQRETVAAAVAAGVNWFDTAATYGAGQSEENLGRTLAELKLADRVHVATKVRVMPEQLDRMAQCVRESVHGSLRRLRLGRVTLLQVHNSITAVAGAEPTSLTPEIVLGPDGMLEEMLRLKREGLVEHLGLTGLGEPAALRQVIDSGEFATIQIPYNLLNPSAGRAMPADFAETDYCNLISYCAERGMGAFAIRVLAGGALAGRPPSPHTLKTPFFPLALYEADRRRADEMATRLPAGMSREEAAVRFAISHPGVTSAIIGLASTAEVADAARFVDAGPLDSAVLARLNGDS
jgi:L-galactose dehydrogenase/L-glyceraldehyde 3-phosphate reductase